MITTSGFKKLSDTIDALDLAANARLTTLERISEKHTGMLASVKDSELTLSGHSIVLDDMQRKLEIVLGKYDELTVNYKNLSKSFTDYQSRTKAQTKSQLDELTNKMQILLLQLGYEFEYTKEIPEQIIPAKPSELIIKKVKR